MFLQMAILAKKFLGFTVSRLMEICCMRYVKYFKHVLWWQRLHVNWSVVTVDTDSDWKQFLVIIDQQRYSGGEIKTRMNCSPELEPLRAWSASEQNTTAVNSRINFWCEHMTITLDYSSSHQIIHQIKPWIPGLKRKKRRQVS